MIIANDLLEFCAVKTSEIEKIYDDTCIFPGEEKTGGHPRSSDDLHVIMMGLHGQIFHRQLRIGIRDARYRSFYIPKPDEIAAYYVSGMTRQQIRYYKTKELMQVHLWRESLATVDIVDLVQNMILRESPAGAELNLTKEATSETLGEIAAMQFLFPLSHRIPHLDNGHSRDDLTALALQYDVPPFVIQRSLNYARPLMSFFKH